MKETDWDMPDEDAIIDFEDMTDLGLIASEKKPEEPKHKPQRDEPPKTTQKIHVEPLPKKEYSPPPPPPRKEEPVMSEKQEKIITNATKQAQKLSKELETLDFQVEKFTKFENRVSSFKIKNTIAIGAVSLFLGGYIGSLAQGELNNYFINQELKHRLSGAVGDLELLKKARAAGVTFAIDDNRIVIYTTFQNKSALVWQDKQYQGLQLKLTKQELKDE